MTRSTMTLGALGGPHTFNGQAAAAMAGRYPEFARIVYFPTSDEATDAALCGAVDATCAPEQTSVSGFHTGMLARMAPPGSRLYAIAEAARIYHCSLLGKPGASLAHVRHVMGHNGSIAHSRIWLETHLPKARIEVVTTHSEVAAQAVLESDGSIASVGSSGLAAKLGLAELARDIDGGSSVNYWAVSLQPRFSAEPSRLVVAARFGGDARLSELVGALLRDGYALSTAYPRPSGRALGEYDYLLTFTGKGQLPAVQSALRSFSSARLAGAFEARGE